jgi:heme exporter protein CcmD
VNAAATGFARLSLQPEAHMSEFLHMSGYAVYVWTSYAIGVASLLLNVWWARRNLARARVAARRRLATGVSP